MTPEQKELVYKLRLQGLSYKAVVKELLLNENTVKGYCKRHGLGGTAEQLQVNDQEIVNGGLCLYCKNPLGHQHRGRTKKFCSDKCRYTWWNVNQDKRKKSSTASYQYSCRHCGKSFVSYGDKHRKYCSHDCYIKARFWQEELSPA